MTGIPEVRLNELYQEVILDHNRNPRNFGRIKEANFYSHGYNPLCGDDYHLYLFIDGAGVIQKLSFEGQGCAISKSSASMMTEALLGKKVDDAKNLGEHFIKVLTEGVVSDSERKEVGRLKIFDGVKNFPVRVKCATLAWHALADALRDQTPPSSPLATTPPLK